MTRTKLPVRLPYQNPTKAYWQTPPLRIADHRTTSTLPTSTKYAIIGSSITGASIAYKLLQEEPDASIVILEARQASSGATGRNGGHCRAGRYLDFKKYLEAFGKEDALKLEKLEDENVRNVGKLVKELDIECDLRDVETLDIFTDRVKWEAALETLAARKEILDGNIETEILTKHRVWSSKETREELLISEGLRAISFPAYALSTYKLTHTPVVEVSQHPTRDSKTEWIVHTERGNIEANKVILATNAYTAALYPPAAEFIIPTRARVAAIRPGSNIANNPALKRTMILEGPISGEYMQSRAEGFSGAGDVIIGGGRRLGTNGEQPILDDTIANPRISEYLTHAAAGYFGRENWGENGKALQEWTGIQGYTLDEQPIVGEAPSQKGLWICAGFHGHGMALTFQSAEVLGQLLMGKEKEVEKWLPKCYRPSRIGKQA